MEEGNLIQLLLKLSKRRKRGKIVKEYMLVAVLEEEYEEGGKKKRKKGKHPMKSTIGAPSEVVADKQEAGQGGKKR